MSEILSGLVLRSFMSYLGCIKSGKEYVVQTLGGVKVPHLWKYLVHYKDVGQCQIPNTFLKELL